MVISVSVQNVHVFRVQRYYIFFASPIIRCRYLCFSTLFLVYRSIDRSYRLDCFVCVSFSPGILRAYTFIYI